MHHTIKKFFKQRLTSARVVKLFNPLSANPTKWSNTPKQFVELFEFV